MMIDEVLQIKIQSILLKYQQIVPMTSAPVTDGDFISYISKENKMIINPNSPTQKL